MSMNFAETFGAVRYFVKSIFPIMLVRLLRLPLLLVLAMLDVRLMDGDSLS